MEKEASQRREDARRAEEDEKNAKKAERKAAKKRREKAKRRTRTGGKTLRRMAQNMDDQQILRVEFGRVFKERTGVDFPVLVVRGVAALIKYNNDVIAYNTALNAQAHVVSAIVNEFPILKRVELTVR